MRPVLKFWRDLTQDQKQEIKQKHNVKTVTYHFIEMVYLKRKL